MPVTDTFVLGADPQGQPVSQALRLTNRHGLVAGATGTGKTVTLQRLAELFSDAGVAVFAADIKGDLCGLGAAGNPQGKVAERIAGMPWLHHQPQAYPVTLWDVAGKSGHPLRTTLSEMGPLLLSNLLELTDSQQAALYAAFQVADREGLLLLDLKDLKALLNHLKDNPEMLGEDRALFAGASSQALLRRLATLEQQGAEALFGEPALQLEDILRPDADGRGRIHLLDASRLVHEAPKVYATFLLWLLAELFEQLPEVGGADNRAADPARGGAFPPAGLVAADPQRVGEILGNLLDNALRHTPPSGIVHISARESRDEVVITVTDTGDGLTPEQLSKVFERFYRADTARARDAGGSGIGLTIARSLALAHGGSLTAASPGPGHGSIFTLHLPTAPAPERVLIDS